MWGVRTGGRLVMNPMTDAPRTWPTKEAAESWAKLSYPDSYKFRGAIVQCWPKGYYKVERIK